MNDCRISHDLISSDAVRMDEGVWEVPTVESEWRVFLGTWRHSVFF